MNECLSSVFFSILINARSRDKFKGEKGLKRGDPLSPFLFNSVVNVLGRLVDKAKVMDLFRG